MIPPPPGGLSSAAQATPREIQMFQTMSQSLQRPLRRCRASPKARRQEVVG